MAAAFKVKINLSWLSLLVCFISSSPPSFALSSKAEKAEDLHQKLLNIDARFPLRLKLSSILDLEYLKKQTHQELNFIRDAHAKRYKGSLAQTEHERVLMSFAFPVDILYRYFNNLEKYLPESDEGKSKLYHRMLNLILFIEENLDDMRTHNGIWTMTPKEYAHLADQIDEAKRHKYDFQRRYGHLDQESLYNIVMPYVYKGVAVVVVAASAYFFGKWYVSRKPVAKPPTSQEVESPRRRGKSRTSAESLRTSVTAEPRTPRDVPLTEEQIEQRKHAKECADRIKAINHILTTEDRNVDEADFSEIHGEAVKLRHHAQKIPSDKEILKSIKALSERIGHVASEFKNLLQEDDLQFSKSGLDDFLEGT